MITKIDLGISDSMDIGYGHQILWDGITLFTDLSRDPLELLIHTLHRTERYVEMIHQMRSFVLAQMQKCISFLP